MLDRVTRKACPILNSIPIWRLPISLNCLISRTADQLEKEIETAVVSPLTPRAQLRGSQLANDSNWRGNRISRLSWLITDHRFFFDLLSTLASSIFCLFYVIFVASPLVFHASTFSPFVLVILKKGFAKQIQFEIWPISKFYNTLYTF